MDATTKAMLAWALEMLSSRLGNDGCNDHAIRVTPQNRDWLLGYADFSDEGGERGMRGAIEKGSERVCTENWMVVDYLAELVRKS